ncbi:MAG: hypothetical protein ABJV68_05195 [Paracoccaceae bacterium]
MSDGKISSIEKTLKYIVDYAPILVFIVLGVVFTVIDIRPWITEGEGMSNVVDTRKVWDWAIVAGLITIALPVATILPVRLRKIRMEAAEQSALIQNELKSLPLSIAEFSASDLKVFGNAEQWEGYRAKILKSISTDLENTGSSLDFFIVTTISRKLDESYFSELAKILALDNHRATARLLAYADKKDPDQEERWLADLENRKAILKTHIHDEDQLAERFVIRRNDMDSEKITADTFLAGEHIFMMLHWAKVSGSLFVYIRSQKISEVLSESIERKMRWEGVTEKISLQ